MERQAVERLLRDSAEARALLENLKAVRQGLLALPRRFAPQDLASSISAQLEREALLGEPRPTGPRSRLSRTASWSVFAAAAVLAFASLLWWQLDRWGTPTAPADQFVSAPSERAAPRLQRMDEQLSDRSEGAALTEEKALDAAAALARKTADPRWSGVAQPGGEGSDAKRGPASSPLTERLLASASLSQKIEAGVGVETLRKHHFDTESTELTIECTSDEQRADVLRTLVNALKEAGAVNLALTEDVPAGAAFAEGKLGVNYSLVEEQQLIVRLPAERWTGVIEAVEKQAVDARTQMRSGLVVGTGWTSAQTLLAGDADATSMGYFAARDDGTRERLRAEDRAEQESPPPMLDARQVSAEAAVRDLVGVLLVPGGDTAPSHAVEPLAEEELAATGVSMGLPPGASSEEEGRSVRVAEATRNAPEGKAPDGKADEAASQMRVALGERKAPPQPGGAAPVDRGEGAFEAEQADKPTPAGGAGVDSARPAARRPDSSEKKAKAAKPAAPAENESPVDAAATPPATKSAGAEVADKSVSEPVPTAAGKEVAAAEPATQSAAREQAALRALGYLDDDAKDAQAESRDSSLVERRRRALAARGRKDEPANRPASAAVEAQRPAGDEAERLAGDQAGRLAGDDVLKELDVNPPASMLDRAAAGAEIRSGAAVSAGRGVAPRARGQAMFGFAHDPDGLPTVVIRLRVVPPAVE